MMDESASGNQPQGVTYQGRPCTWGMRFSLLDGIVILIVAAATVYLWPIDPNIAFLLPFTLGHFFLFCNIFRVRRKPELVWATVFLLNFGAWWLSGAFSWLSVCAIQLPLTVYLLWQETRKPWYHGIAARRLNDHLDDYLKGDV